jgi:hypothetical protein
MTNSRDLAVLRELAAQYAAVSREPVQEERRSLWRRHNSLKTTRPLIYTRAFAWKEMPQSNCVCEDPFFRAYEGQLRNKLYWHSLNDDSIFEPWITVTAAKRHTGWGFETVRHFSGESRGSFKIEYPLKALADLDRMQVPRHEIDEAKTAEAVRRLEEAIGDLLTVNVDRGPAYTMWSADLSTDLGYLRGIENIMMDMMDEPEWLHRLAGFMSQGVLKAQGEAEKAGDWGLCDHQNQAMPYAEELPDPAANRTGVSRKQLWVFMAAQEFTAISPAMHEEFLLRYQMPIMSQFGLAAYGCCEDLTRKIDMLRQIPNLRRIAVSPMANVPRCAEQIKADYVLSYRPSPSDMVGYGWDEARIRRIMKRDLEACKGCHVDITLKDVETVEGDPKRVKRWVEIAREISASLLDG